MIFFTPKSLLAGVVIGIVVFLFSERVGRGNATFKSNTVYLANKLYVNPKIGDWVVYSIPVAMPDCDHLIGKVHDIKDGNFLIFREPSNNCDSSTYGYLKPKLQGVIYPDYEIEV
jgi:hypothetical protein